MDKSKKLIRSNQYPHNMSPWLGEKTEYVAEEIGRLYDTLHEKYPNLLQDEEIIDIFYQLLFDFSKIRSFAEGTEWQYPKVQKEATVFDIFKANGLASFIKPGKAEIAHNTHITAVTRFLIEWKELIAGTKAESRTLLHELFNRKGFNDTRADYIENLLYLVSDNQLTWEQFQGMSTEYIIWLTKMPFLQ